MPWAFRTNKQIQLELPNTNNQKKTLKMKSEMERKNKEPKKIREIRKKLLRNKRAIQNGLNLWEKYV